MKKLLFFVLMCISLSAYAKTKVVKEVCGVEYGTPYAKAKASFDKLFGDSQEIKETNTILYENVTYQGMKFEVVYLYFFPEKKSKNKLTLQRVIFINTCDKKEDLPEKCSQMAEAIGASYELNKKEINGLPIYYGGKNPVNDALPGVSIMGSYIKEYDIYMANLGFWPSPN